MGTDANIELVKQSYAAFGRGDIASVLATLDPNVTWTSPGNLPESGTHHGHAGVAKFFQSVAELWDFQAFEPKEFIASGDRVAVCGSYTMTARPTGRTVSSDWVMVWRIRDGKAVEFQEYTDTGSLEKSLSAAAAA